MARLHIQELCSSRFNWHRPEPGCARATQEISTLMGPLRARIHAPNDGLPGGRVYDDACDFGFIMVSHRTGRRVLMLLSGQDERDGEVQGWRYTAWSEDTGKVYRTLPEAERFELLLVND